MFHQHPSDINTCILLLFVAYSFKIHTHNQLISTLQSNSLTSRIFFQKFFKIINYEYCTKAHVKVLLYIHLYVVVAMTVRFQRSTTTEAVLLRSARVQFPVNLKYFITAITITVTKKKKNFMTIYGCTFYSPNLMQYFYFFSF